MDNILYIIYVFVTFLFTIEFTIERVKDVAYGINNIILIISWYDYMKCSKILKMI